MNGGGKNVVPIPFVRHQARVVTYIEETCSPACYNLDGYFPNEGFETLTLMGMSNRKKPIDSELIPLIREHCERETGKIPCDGCPCEGKGFRVCAQYCPDILPFIMSVKPEEKDESHSPCPDCVFNAMSGCKVPKICARLRAYQDSNAVSVFGRNTIRNGGRKVGGGPPCP